MSTDAKFLTFPVKFMGSLNLWPARNDYEDNKWRVVKDVSLILSLMPCAIPILGDFTLHIYEGVHDLAALTENLIALNCIAGMIYMTICFIKKRRLILKLVLNLKQFTRFTEPENIIDTDKRANLYSKIFIFYGFMGNIVYMIMPYINREKCIENRLHQDMYDPVPCGLVTRCRFPFKFDYTPVFEIVFMHQFYTCTMVTVVILVVTMLLCGILMHITNQLRILRRCIGRLHDPASHLVYELFFCIKYHIAIIRFADDMNEAFSTMMMLHLTLTSLVISALGFQVIMVDHFYDSLRFALHLLGWIVLLLLVCFYAQFLIDESSAIAEEIYCTPWFEMPASLQKYIYMILIRSEKSLKLRAANVGFMSLPTFLRVIYSAYSYFTLLLNMKN